MNEHNHEDLNTEQYIANRKQLKI